MYKQTNTICKTEHIQLFQVIINCTMIMKTNSRFSWNVYAISDRIWCNKHLRHTTTENMITMGKVDTSDLMMIITWAIDISFQSPKLKWASWTHTTPLGGPLGGSMASCRVCVQLQHLGQFWPYTTSVNLPNWNTDIRRHLDHCHWTYISQ